MELVLNSSPLTLEELRKQAVDDNATKPTKEVEAEKPPSDVTVKAVETNIETGSDGLCVVRLSGQYPAKIAITDIETIPDESRMHLFDLPSIPEDIPETPLDALLIPEEFNSTSVDEQKQHMAGKNPPPEWIQQALNVEQSKKNRKTAVAFLEELANRRNLRDQAIADRNKKMAVCPEMLRIVAIAISFESEVVSKCVTAIDDDQERSLLEFFWMSIGERPISGFNIIEFDVPAILARSILLGVKPTRALSLGRYSNDFKDLMMARFPSGRCASGWGLKNLCRAYGIEFDDDTHGGKVLELFQAGEYGKIAEYCGVDVQRVAWLHEAWKDYFV